MSSGLMTGKWLPRVVALWVQSGGNELQLLLIRLLRLSAGESTSWVSASVCRRSQGAACLQTKKQTPPLMLLLSFQMLC